MRASGRQMGWTGWPEIAGIALSCVACRWRLSCLLPLHVQVSPHAPGAGAALHTAPLCP